MDTTTFKDKLARFGRSLALLLNRSLMYQKTHPIVKDSVKDAHKWAKLLFNSISPVVFILNRELFYVDEEQLDHRINVKRIATIFKSHGLQSVSFEAGLTESELEIFVEIFSSMTTETNANTVKKGLLKKGAYNIKVNHVLYKKVTEDDQVVSREALKQVTPNMEDDDSESRKKFMDTLLQTILTDEFANTLNIKSLLANPELVSKNMIDADLASAEEFSSRTPGGYGTGMAGIGSGPGSVGPGMTGTGGGGAPGPGGTPELTDPQGATGGGGAGTGSGTTGITGGQDGAGGPGGTGDGGETTGGMGGPGAGGEGSHGGLGGTGDGGSGSTGSTGGPGAGGEGSRGGLGGTGDGGSGSTGSTGGPGAGGEGSRGGLGGTGDGGSGSAEVDGGTPGGGGTGTVTDGIPSSPTALHGDGSVDIADVVEGASAMTTGTGEESNQSMDLQPRAGKPSGSHGHMLLHQLDLMQQEVQKHLEGGGDISLEALADAVFDLKKQLFEDIQTQKALGIAYTNEDAIVDNINELTDQVLLSLIKEEYKDGNISTQRFAQIILRLIPDAKELKRLLPQIKQVLIESGMPPEGYLDLLDELKHELENEDLSRIIEESSEAIGVDSEELIQELKDDSGQAAKLIYLASEIRKGGGDESALADILVDYVEEMTNQAAQNSEEEGGEEHLKKVISDVESTVLGQLAKMDVGQDVLMRMEDRINDRMDSMLDRMRVEWLKSQTGTAKQEKVIPLTVLQTIEHHLGDDEAMVEIIKAVRAKVDEGEIEENDFNEIQLEIDRQKKIMAAQADSLEKPEGVLSPNELMYILEKEIARANRYDAPFSAIAFSFVKFKPTMKALEELISTESVMNASLDKLVNTIREGDYIGQIGKDKIVALLPMQAYSEAKLALERMMNIMHNESLMVRDVPVQLRMAGVVTEFNSEQTPDAQAFAKKLTNQLMDMVSRLKNIQVLF